MAGNGDIGGGSCVIKVNGKVVHEDKQATKGPLTFTFPQHGGKAVRLQVDLQKGDVVHFEWD